MAKQTSNLFVKPKKKTSIAGNYARTKLSSMNKSKRRSLKKYRGQGR